MLASFKQNLFSNWSFRRFIGLGLGLFLAIQSVQLGDSLLGLVSVFLLFQVIANIGCFGNTGCAIAYDETVNPDNEIKDVKFTEIK